MTQSQAPVGVAPKVKGITLRSAMQAFERLRGKEASEAVLSAMPAQVADAIRYGAITASGWYPMQWYHDLHASIVSTTSEGERIIREVESEAARADMTGVYKVAFSLLSPEVVFRLSAKLFSRYYDTGKLEICETRKGYVRARWSGCTGFHRTVWVGIFASSQAILEIAGADNVRMHIVAGGGSDDDFAEGEAFWTT